MVVLLWPAHFACCGTSLHFSMFCIRIAILSVRDLLCLCCEPCYRHSDHYRCKRSQALPGTGRKEYFSQSTCIQTTFYVVFLCVIFLFLRSFFLIKIAVRQVLSV